MKLNDRNILKQLRKGDIKSFESLFHQFHQGMLLYAISILKNEATAEEIVQDVFYNIWKNRGEFNLKNTWQAYLYKAVYNNAIMYIRKHNKEILLGDNSLINIEGTTDDPSEKMEYKGLRKDVEITLKKLPERTQNIFSMSRFEGMKYQEIANKLEISIKTVEANMGRALKAFRVSLRNYDY